MQSLTEGDLEEMKAVLQSGYFSQESLTEALNLALQCGTVNMCQVKCLLEAGASVITGQGLANTGGKPHTQKSSPEIGVIAKQGLEDTGRKPHTQKNSPEIGVIAEQGLADTGGNPHTHGNSLEIAVRHHDNVDCVILLLQHCKQNQLIELIEGKMNDYLANTMKVAIENGHENCAIEIYNCRLKLTPMQDVQEVLISPDSKCYSPLRAAAQKSMPKLVRTLIESLPEEDKQLGMYLALIEAAKLQQYDMLQHLVRLGVDINYTSVGSRYEKSGKAGDVAQSRPAINCRTCAYSVLSCACKLNDLHMMKLLLEEGGDRNVSLENSYIILDAVIHRNSDMVALLIKHGVDVNVKTDNQWTPLFYAIKLDESEILRMLVDAGANVKATLGDCVTPLHLSATNRHSKCLMYILDNMPQFYLNLDNINCKISLDRSESDLAQFDQMPDLNEENDGGSSVALDDLDQMQNINHEHPDHVGQTQQISEDVNCQPVFDCNDLSVSQSQHMPDNSSNNNPTDTSKETDHIPENALPDICKVGNEMTDDIPENTSIEITGDLQTPAIYLDPKLLQFISQTVPECGTALSVAAQYSNDENVVTLIQHGADANLVYWYNGTYTTPLLDVLLTFTNNRLRHPTLTLIRLLQQGADVNPVGTSEHPLDIAVGLCILPIAQLLWDAGSTPCQNLKWFRLRYCWYPRSCMEEFLTNIAEQPRRLRNITRNCIRKVLGSGIQNKLTNILLPVSLKEYVNLSDLFVYVDTLAMEYPEMYHKTREQQQSVTMYEGMFNVLMATAVQRSRYEMVKDEYVLGRTLQDTGYCIMSRWALAEFD